jgi:hypothetical protein
MMHRHRHEWRPLIIAFVVFVAAVAYCSGPGRLFFTTTEGSVPAISDLPDFGPRLSSLACTSKVDYVYNRPHSARSIVFSGAMDSEKFLDFWLPSREHLDPEAYEFRPDRLEALRRNYSSNKSIRTNYIKGDIHFLGEWKTDRFEAFCSRKTGAFTVIIVSWPTR